MQDDKIFELRSKSCSLDFVLRAGKFLFTHFGKTCSSAGDLAALMPDRHDGITSLRRPLQATYPAYGDIDFFEPNHPSRTMEAYGALGVVHADGVASTVLVAVDSAITEDAPGVRHLVLKMRDENYGFFVTQHFRTYDDCDVFETWIELTNDEAGAVAINKMDSFALEMNLMGRNATVFNLRGTWGAEAHISETTLAQSQTISLGSRSGIHGAWYNNPAFMVAYGNDSTETYGRVFGGALAWSGAWQASITRTSADALLIHSGVDNCSGPYILDSGKSITLPRFIFTYSDEGRGQISRNFHKWARLHCMPRGKELRPILLNSWEGAYFNFSEKTLTDMMDGVRDFGGEMFVIDDGWFGLGEFARNDDHRGLGDWVWNTDKLPHGPKYLADEAAKRGIRLGLWFEPEMANTNSELVKKHPDWVLSEPTRPLRKGRGTTQVVLDMCNPDVRDKIFRQIDELLTAVPGITYIKWDANSEIMNPGSPYLPKDRQCNLWFDYTSGYLELADRLAKKHPDVMFQACASGGGHAEFGSLSTYADEFWGSDDTDAHMRVFIQWGEMLFYPANSVACHVTASPNHQTRREIPLKYRFDVAMSGRLGFELHPGNMDAQDIPYVKECVETYKRIRPIVQQGDLYRLASPYDGDYASLMYVNEDKSKAVLFVYGIARGIYANYIPPIRLQGLDASRRYLIKELGVRNEHTHANTHSSSIGADALATVGLPVWIAAGYDSAVFELTAE